MTTKLYLTLRRFRLLLQEPVTGFHYERNQIFFGVSWSSLRQMTSGVKILTCSHHLMVGWAILSRISLLLKCRDAASSPSYKMAKNMVPAVSAVTCSLVSLPLPMPASGLTMSACALTV